MGKNVTVCDIFFNNPALFNIKFVAGDALHYTSGSIKMMESLQLRLQVRLHNTGIYRSQCCGAASFLCGSGSG
jgi:hypothetical protein